MLDAQPCVRYAGAYFFGRSRQRRLSDHAPRFKQLPREEWLALIPNAHPGYISWDEFENNQRRLRENSAAHGAERRRSPPREGPALLQGLVVCGRCGDRMTVRYHQRHGRGYPEYSCQRRGIERGESRCQTIPGAALDEAIGERLVGVVTPLTLEVALQVRRELEDRIEQTDALRRQHVERARYEGELARQRYMEVDPKNRLVADALEREWNDKLRAFQHAQEEYEKSRRERPALLDDGQQSKILDLATDFPRLWKDPKLAQRDRKRIVRLLIEDVTLNRSRGIQAHIRFRGGATQSLTFPPPAPAWLLRKTPREIVAEVDRLLANHTHSEIAANLNARGLRRHNGECFHRHSVRRIQKAYGLKPRYDRLREAGMLTLSETAARLAVCPATVKVWRRNGFLRAHVYNDKGECLYEPTGDEAPVKHKHKRKGLLPVTGESPVESNG